ncbi:MAG TPA: hypothetical protein VNS29_06990 [Burkholderiaceae bacterium]|nr:hypothetical protein [Pollutimonas sp. M17]UYO95630.1 hypothetical protein OEG81_07340 [Pollutimonas sp. M17]HWK70573.1 hypothetical protein [Burkholderiaceae bacterium]
MNDVSVIDHFLNIFSIYIDSGFGLLRGEVAYLKDIAAESGLAHRAVVDGQRVASIYRRSVVLVSGR